ncbi:MAG: gas vesicle protein K [Phycisphaerales bacterium]
MSSVTTQTRESPHAPRIDLDEDTVRQGLGRLVVTIIKLLHELLERQAIRRIDSGSLTQSEIEALGRAMQAQAKEIDRLRREFGLEHEDLNLDLGPLGTLF